MGLKGELEDLPLIDMLQIIAFSKKSGYLRVAGPSGRGAVIVFEGRILFAFSWSTMERIRELAHDPDKISIASNRKNIEAALRELAGLREGSFKFELTSEISDDLGGVRIKPFMIPGGIDPQELLLDLAVEIDNERREATTLVELAFQGDPPVDAEVDEALEHELGSQPNPIVDTVQESTLTEKALASVETVEAAPLATIDAEVEQSSHTVVVVDDESPVTDVVGEELRVKGYQVFTASSPGEGANLVRTHLQNGESVLVAIDLKMPTSSGESFFGGFELIGRLQSDRLHVPVLLMVESLENEEREQAKALGIGRIVYKPTLTKPDPKLYRADLREFTDSVDTQLKKLIEDHQDGADAPVRAGDGEDGVERMDFLARMTKKLVEPGGSTDVSVLVMQVAARFLERGVLFVVKSDAARGLAGFGFGASKKNCADITRNLSLSIEDAQVLTEVVTTGKTLRLREEPRSLDGSLSSLSSLFGEIGRGNASEGVLMPMLYSGATLLLLYGDNGVSGRALDDLDGLELFMAQAGMALENKLLQRKLGSAEHAAADNMEQGVQR